MRSLNNQQHEWWSVAGIPVDHPVTPAHIPAASVTTPITIDHNTAHRSVPWSAFRSGPPPGELRSSIGAAGCCSLPGSPPVTCRRCAAPAPQQQPRWADASPPSTVSGRVTRHNTSRPQTAGAWRPGRLRLTVSRGRIRQPPLTTSVGQ